MSTVRVEIKDASSVGEARRAASLLAAGAGMGETAVGRVAIVATELASNALKHSGSGEILIQTGDDPGSVDLLALDRGRGIENLAAALRDGHSSAGTSGPR